MCHSGCCFKNKTKMQIIDVGYNPTLIDGDFLSGRWYRPEMDKAFYCLT